MSTDREQNQRNMEEFASIQDYMEVTDKDSEAYRRMKKRYKLLKAILQSSGVNLDEIDYIKE